MHWNEYIEQDFVEDLAAFRLAYSKILGRDLASLDEEPPYLVHILEGHVEGVRKALGFAKIRHQLAFLRVTFLEGALLAGVHAYDFSNHQKYRKALPYEVFIEHFPNISVLHPQSILGAHGTEPEQWSADDLRLLEDWTYELAVRWAAEYDRRIASLSGTGKTNLTAMAGDPDLARAGSWIVPEPVRDAYMRGLRRAAEDAPE